ncbi:MAG: hypothetical protein WC453_03570 [Patescibacteria group bacterium]
MLRIKIIEAPGWRDCPPGIQHDLVGCTIEVPRDADIEREGGHNLISEDDFVVRITDVIAALKRIGRYFAANYWEKVSRQGKFFLVFSMKNTELIY